MKVLKDGSTTEDPRLDRLALFDERSRGWSVGRLRAQGRERPLRGRGWMVGPGLDQGNEGQCVRYGTAHWQNARPSGHKPAMADQRAMTEDYWEMQRRDPWPGGEYPGATPRYGGTAVLTAMQLGVERGWWKEYWWCGAGSGDALGDMVWSIANVGGNIIGVPWYQSMFEPHPSGLLEVDPTSGAVGGHCVYVPATRLKMRLRGEWTGTRSVFVVQQSWGEDGYGVGDLRRPGGMVYVTEEGMGTLLHDGGEAAVPIR